MPHTVLKSVTDQSCEAETGIPYGVLCHFGRSENGVGDSAGNMPQLQVPLVARPRNHISSFWDRVVTDL